MSTSRRRGAMTPEIQARIEATVATWSPLTPEQRDVIRRALAPAAKAHAARKRTSNKEAA